MNNLVFNTEAKELKTTLYAQSPDASIQILQLDNDSNLKVTITNTTITIGSVSISNASLTVNGTITVGNSVTIANTSLTVNIPEPITIGNNSLTVIGTITVGNQITIANTTLTVNVPNPITIGNNSLTVNGTITVGNPITIANSTLTSIIAGSTFTELAVTNTVVNTPGNIFPDTDISTLKTISMFVYNTGTNSLTISLQFTPTLTATYIDDPNYTDIILSGNSNKFIAVTNFAHFIQLNYNPGLSTCTFSAYLNGQA